MKPDDSEPGRGSRAGRFRPWRRSRPTRRRRLPDFLDAYLSVGQALR